MTNERISSQARRPPAGICPPGLLREVRNACKQNTRIAHIDIFKVENRAFLWYSHSVSHSVSHSCMRAGQTGRAPIVTSSGFCRSGFGCSMRTTFIMLIMASAGRVASEEGDLMRCGMVNGEMVRWELRWEPAQKEIKSKLKLNNKEQDP